MVELLVDNEPLDLTEKFLMSFQVADISDIERRQGDFTYEFDLPATQKNKRLLKRSHTIFGYPYQFIEAWIRSSADIKKGFIQVMEYNGAFKANFFSGNANWIALIGDKLLSDLNLSKWDHDYTRANVIDSFSHTEGYIYPLMNVYSGPEREAYIGMAGNVTYPSSQWVGFDDINGEFFNEGKYENPAYTLDDDYSLSIFTQLIIGAFTASSCQIVIAKKYPSGYQGITSLTISATGTYTLKITSDLKKDEAVGVYLLISGGDVRVDTGSYVRFTTGISDLENISSGDLYPAIYVHSLIKEIFQEINFKLAGPFLNNSDYLHLIMPFVGTTFATPGQQTVNRSMYLGLLSPVTIATGTMTFDNESSPYYTGDDYTGPGYYPDAAFSIVVEALLSASAQSSSSTDVSITKNGTPLDTETFTGNPYVELYAETTVTDSDVIEIKVTSTGGDITFSTLSWWKITASALIGEDEQVKTTVIVPEMKQIDLIKWLFVSFGVVPVTDDFSKTLALTEFRAIKQKPAEDWSTRLAVDYDIDFYEFASGYAKRNNFKYQESDEPNLKNYRSANDKGYGDGKIQLDNVFLTGETDLFTTDLVPVWFEEITRNGVSANLATFIRDAKPRILFVVPDALISDFSDISETLIEGDVYPITSIAWAYFTKYKLESDLDEFRTNLSYLMPAILNGNGNGLLSKYWEDYAGIINRPKKLIAPFKLTTKDIITLDYTRRKYIEGENITGNYFLNRIKDFDFDNGIVQCELMLLDNLDIVDEIISQTEDSEISILDCPTYSGITLNGSNIWGAACRKSLPAGTLKTFTIDISSGSGDVEFYVCPMVYNSYQHENLPDTTNKIFTDTVTLSVGLNIITINTAITIADTYAFCIEYIASSVTWKTFQQTDPPDGCFDDYLMGSSRLQGASHPAAAWTPTDDTVPLKFAVIFNTDSIFRKTWSIMTGSNVYYYPQAADNYITSIGQQFRVFKSGNLLKVHCLSYYYIGSPTGTWKIKIYDQDGSGYPNNLIAESLSSITPIYGYKIHEVDINVALNPGNYICMIEYNGDGSQDNSNKYTFLRSYNYQAYLYGDCVYYDGSWHSINRTLNLILQFDA